MIFLNHLYFQANILPNIKNWIKLGITSVNKLNSGILAINNAGVGTTLFSRFTIKNAHKLFIIWKPIANSRPPSNTVIKLIKIANISTLDKYAVIPYSQGSGFDICRIANKLEVEIIKKYLDFVMKENACKI